MENLRGVALAVESPPNGRREVALETVLRVSRTELLRNMRQVIQSVQRGQTVLIERHGQPEVAIVDIIDYRLGRAVLRYHAHLPEIDSTAGLSDEGIAALPDEQARYNLVRRITWLIRLAWREPPNYWA
jgi:antitoxin (DNA-binding transcriptional repressor) of toxin-antitoxin stability system